MDGSRQRRSLNDYNMSAESKLHGRRAMDHDNSLANKGYHLIMSSHESVSTLLPPESPPAHPLSIVVQHHLLMDRPDSVLLRGLGWTVE